MHHYISKGRCDFTICHKYMMYDKQINGGNSETKIKWIIIVLLVIPKNHWKKNCS